MDQNPYEAPREAQSPKRERYLPALLVLLVITVLASIALVAHLRNMRLQQAVPANAPQPKIRAVQW